MEDTQWAIAIASLILGGGGVAAILQTVRWWFDRRDKIRMARSVPEALIDINQIYKAMNKLMNDVGASQVLILKAKNGGKVPVPGAKLTSSVVYEVIGPGSQPVASTWQDQVLDEDYISMLVEINDNGALDIVTEELADNSTLKGVYISHNIYKSKIMGLRAEKGVYFYMSITWTKKPSVHPEVVNNSIRIAKNAIQIILDKRPQGGVSI